MLLFVRGTGRNKSPPDGYYNNERMLKRAREQSHSSEIVENTRRSTMGELTAATVKAGKVFVFLIGATRCRPIVRPDICTSCSGPASDPSLPPGRAAPRLI